MDHYIPKRRIPVTLWSDHLQGVTALVFLDPQHQTIRKPNESPPFIPVAGEDGRAHLVHRRLLIRSPQRHVLQSDIYARGFQPRREER
jgi:hypothetical protein